MIKYLHLFLHLFRTQLIKPMKKFIYKILVVASLSISIAPTQAYAEFYIFPYSGTSKHRFTAPYTGQFTALNGDYFDVSNYYASKGLELNISGIGLFVISPSITMKVPWYFDNGYKSDVYSIKSILQLGASIVFIEKKSTYEIGITNLFGLGGNVHERPCVDVLYREFHCGLGVPWVDRPAIKKNTKKTVSISYKFIF